MNILTDLEIERNKPVVEDITEADIPELLTKTSDMVNLFLEKGGMGLAATQVGINKNYFVIMTNSEKVEIMINPKYFYNKRDVTKTIEKSLSNPDSYIVERAKKINAVYYSTDGKKLIRRTKEFKGENAFLYQHLFDYLKGITIKEKGEEIEEDK